MDWRDIPSLSALRAFEAAARLENYSAAARTLNVTHAAIAQHVRALESHFGQSLIEREGKRMVPTSVGRRLANDLANGFAEIAAGVRTLMDAAEEGPISLTTTQTFAENWLMPRLSGFWSAHPDIPLTITPDNRVRDLRREGHHLAIRYGRGTWPGLEARFLTSANKAVVAHPSVVAQLPDSYDPAAPDAVQMLARLPWVIDTSFGEFFSWFRAQGLEEKALSTTKLMSNSLVLAACRAGAGVSMQPYAVVERDIEEGRLVLLRQQCDAELGYYILRQPGPVPARVKVFEDWLVACAAEC
ncbi:LysR family transcriptional regulator [Rhodophyticola sp. CCM32]|uniref:LysR family transcriptional regulator n=1 Tax=Rhodophyticola sp. CCM32 TaxID=2916397 RepID=UPI00107F83DB|nr:LysR family transcriptional regulator [Rhodophyticola sp. CCM32]QBY02407.1 LysR family transcriptional regulator [Rhodophyticola sp. CCM32]